PADAQAYARLTRAAADGGADLVVWPEHAVGEYVQEPSPARDLVLAASRRTGADLVLGAPSYDAGAGGPTYHNSVFLVRDGTLAGRYDKQRLLPVAEDGALATMLPGAGRYASGRPVRGLRARDALVGASICFEAMYPELVRGIVAGGAELLVNVSNDVWFGHASPAETHLAMAALRAVENRRWLVRAAATGVSAVVDPAGRVVARAEFGVPGVVSATVRPLHVRTPYQRWGDGAAWLLAALAAAASLRRPRKTQLAHVEGGTS
ncbi:MAG TPA: apolipoprotein N-acyltransferase, partial [Candidatus Binatia bacterium]|nr:apolipoprotein N-acyltransferase [Candidatus Binatia bacterium]